LRRKRKWLSESKAPTYATVKLPTSFAEKIDAFLENQTTGYTSRPDFIKDAVRRLLSTLSAEDS
jgi:Arc/MetJ-type ribon-helix-helix transcriptional regulator